MTIEKANQEAISATNDETLFLFPERCSLGVVESRMDDVMSPVRFSIVDLALQSSNRKDIHDIMVTLRKSNSVRLTQLPQLMKESDEVEHNSLIISFHEENDVKRDWENPLMATVVSMGPNPNQKELKSFNENIVRLETLGLSLDFGDDITVLMLLDLLAVGSSIFDDMPVLIGNYFMKPVYYGEFQPILDNSLEPLIHALGHKHRSKSAAIHENSIDLSGLVPDGLA